MSHLFSCKLQLEVGKSFTLLPFARNSALTVFTYLCSLWYKFSSCRYLPACLWSLVLTFETMQDLFYFSCVKGRNSFILLRSLGRMYFPHFWVSLRDWGQVKGIVSLVRPLLSEFSFSVLWWQQSVPKWVRCVAHIAGCVYRVLNLILGPLAI